MRRRTLLKRRPTKSACAIFTGRQIKGRLAGIEEATLEIIRGVRSHYELAGQPPPDDVAKAAEAVRTFARAANHQKNIDRYQTRLWIFGDAVGAACWRKGYDVCKLQMTPARSEKIRFDLSIDELLQLTSLAHLGFKKMMPNDRGIEMLRFCDEAHAQQGTEAVERLERANSGAAKTVRSCRQSPGVDPELVAAGAQARLVMRFQRAADDLFARWFLPRPSAAAK